jgi:hypothetical protein
MSKKFKEIAFSFEQPKYGAAEAIREYVQRNTKLTAVDLIETNSYHGSLTVVFALSYEETQFLPEVKANLDVFPQRE